MDCLDRGPLVTVRKLADLPVQRWEDPLQCICVFSDAWVMAFPPSCNSQGQDTSSFSSPASTSAESEAYQLVFHDSHATPHNFGMCSAYLEQSMLPVDFQQLPLVRTETLPR